jgi:transcriptional regulator
MYIQDRFREERIETLHAFIREHALGTVVVGSPQLEAFPMPLELVSDGKLGVLRGHVVRANHLSQVPSGTAVLVMFQSANAYISPRWYVNGQQSGRVAPSWNFAAVHATGPIRFIDDSSWVRAHLDSIVHAQEAGRERPWSLGEAPGEFIDDLVRRLIGLEIDIARLEGKRFLSQHRTPGDRESLARHLRAESRGAAHDVARDIEAIDVPRDS